MMTNIVGVNDPPSHPLWYARQATLGEQAKASSRCRCLNRHNLPYLKH